METCSRRSCLLKLSALATLPLTAGNMEREGFSMNERPIPSTQEKLPVIGIGTWQTFDVGNTEAEQKPLQEVLKVFRENGGKTIDSSPMYGRSEATVGELSTAMGINQQLFIATKVWTSGKENGIRQMKESMSLLQRQQIDLMQVHNVVDWQVHLNTLRDWKEKGKIRYIGITHYLDSAHETLADIIKKHPIDFVQVNYNLSNRHAENFLFPIAQEKKVAVLINRPFEEGYLFRKVKGKALPPWAHEFQCTSWAQLFLKFILSHPAVTCVIPGTSRPDHMRDNVGAGYGNVFDEKTRKKLIQLLD